MLMRFVSVVVLLLSAACTAPTRDLTEEIAPIGNFRLGQLVPRAEVQLAKGPLSRSASREEWMQVLDVAFTERFSRFEGGSYYTWASRRADMSWPSRASHFLRHRSLS